MAGEKLGEEKKKPGAKAQMLARFATSLSAGTRFLLFFTKIFTSH